MPCPRGELTGRGLGAHCRAQSAEHAQRQLRATGRDRPERARPQHRPRRRAAAGRRWRPCGRALLPPAAGRPPLAATSNGTCGWNATAPSTPCRPTWATSPCCCTTCAATGEPELAALGLRDLRGWLAGHAPGRRLADHAWPGGRPPPGRSPPGRSSSGLLPADVGELLASPRPHRCDPGGAVGRRGRARRSTRIDGDEPEQLRDRLILELLYGTGIRVAELVGLDLADLDRGRRVLRVIGKGDKQRTVPYGVPADAALQPLAGPTAGRPGRRRPPDRRCCSAGAAAGSTSAPPGAVVNRVTAGLAGGSGLSPHGAAAQRGHPPARRRRRPARRAGTARPRQPGHHPDLHPRLGGPAAGQLLPGPPAGLIGSTPHQPSAGRPASGTGSSRATAAAGPPRAAEQLQRVEVVRRRAGRPSAGSSPARQPRCCPVDRPIRWPARTCWPRRPRRLHRLVLGADPVRVQHHHAPRGRPPGRRTGPPRPRLPAPRRRPARARSTPRWPARYRSRRRVERSQHPRPCRPPAAGIAAGCSRPTAAATGSAPDDRRPAAPGRLAGSTASVPGQGGSQHCPGSGSHRLIQHPARPRPVSRPADRRICGQRAARPAVHNGLGRATGRLTVRPISVGEHAGARLNPAPGASRVTSRARLPITSDAGRRPTSVRLDRAGRRPRHPAPG